MYLDQEPQVDILALGFLPVDLTVLVMSDVNSLETMKQQNKDQLKMAMSFLVQRLTFMAVTSKRNDNSQDLFTERNLRTLAKLLLSNE